MNIKRISFYGLFFGNLAITLYFWWQGSGSLFTGGTSGALIALGRLTGLVGALLILTQLVLVGRIKIIEREYGFDNLNRLHRTLGKVIIFVILAHPLFLTIGYALGSNISILEQFITFLTTWQYVFWAFIGLVVMCSVVGISLAIIRKKIKYETWYFTHLFMYVAIGLIFTHQVQTADVSYGIAIYYWYVLNFTIFGLVLVYRFIRPLYLFNKYQFIVEKIVTESPTIQSVYITGRNLKNFVYESGQYANIIFLKKGLWFSHPFSFSKAHNANHIRFSIRSSGDFTSRISELKPGTRVIIDGPLGAFTEKKAKRDKYLFIAGGIGITPIRSLIETLGKKNKDMILLYGNRTVEDTAFINELNQLKVKYHLVLSSTEDSQHESGYVDAEKMQRLVPDLKDREVYLCGPTVMMDFVVSELQKIGLDISHIHYERFAY